ncbi:MAG: DUF2272 domain-containing protein [Rhodocyclaceae bacterium]
MTWKPPLAARVAMAVCVLVLAACGTTPPATTPGQPLPPPTARPQPVPIPDRSLPPVVQPALTQRQRIVDIARQEWRRWGSQTVDVTLDGRSCVRDSAVPPPPAYLAARAAAAAGDSALAAEVAPCLRFADGSGMEATPEGCALALRYWHVLGREPTCVDITQLRWAWSAAFISWVMREAGLNDDQFLTGEAHSMYVADARDGILATPAYTVDSAPAMPAPGDMVCTTRDAAVDVTAVEDIRFGRTPMHCDIVVEVDAPARRVKAIGGNVQQSVSMSLIEYDAAAGYWPWLLVMRNQLP